MANVYNKGKFGLTTGSILFLSDTIRAMLVTSAYTFDADHNYVSDVVANEVTNGGYVRQDLATKTITEDDSLNRVVFDCDDPVFPSLAAGDTPDALIVYKFGTSDADSELICYGQLVAPASPAGADYTIVIDSAGLLYAGD